MYKACILVINKLITSSATSRNPKLVRLNVISIALARAVYFDISCIVVCTHNYKPTSFSIFSQFQEWIMPFLTEVSKAHWHRLHSLAIPEATSKQALNHSLSYMHALCSKYQTCESFLGCYQQWRRGKFIKW